MQKKEMKETARSEGKHIYDSCNLVGAEAVALGYH